MRSAESYQSSNEEKLKNLVIEITGIAGIFIFSFGIGAWFEWQVGVTVFGALLITISYISGKRRG